MSRAKAKAVGRGISWRPVSMRQANMPPCAMQHRNCTALSLVAFLDDLYVVTTRERARGHDTVVHAVERECGIASNVGKFKTRVFFPNRRTPPELGPDACRGDRPAPQRGIIVLGVPIQSAIRSSSGLGRNSWINCLCFRTSSAHVGAARHMRIATRQSCFAQSPSLALMVAHYA